MISKTMRVALTVAWLAVAVALLAVPVAAYGQHWGIFPQIPAMFVSFRVALGAAALGVLLGVVALWLARFHGWRSRPFLTAAVSSLVSLSVLVLLVERAQQARAQPPGIHDITTDTDSPPAFEALLAERKASARNPADYNPAVAPLQRRTYPDIQPILIDRPLEAAFDQALAAARAMGWAIAAADKLSGRIEATATTTWFEFKDDVVIRVTEAAPGKSRVDVRSLSRIGGGDQGQNAARVRAYSARLRG
ncbi:MAG: DUF1499 domain-containing protein [Proteobacteria bacterium]|nr:DUF1499 domain-containing protein [Pseudomonadota bacterium]MBI3496636.1 DUF1499 domain-containing protein [Pseudomonadota bacterium]